MNKTKDIKSLKESPLFNLSLASKELFHSNFIDWLIRIDKKNMSEVFSKLLNQNIKIKDCSREKNNLDLYIECEEKNVVIENKFKSIITEEQLVDYNKKLNDEIRILLTLHNEANELTITKKHNWIIVGYDRLTEGLSKINTENKYHKHLIKDYCNFVNIIHAYFSQKNYDSETIGTMRLTYEELGEIRLHDIYQKILFNYTLTQLRYKLKKHKNKFSSWQDFWRATGTISLNYDIEPVRNDDKENLRIELQLQYDSIKLMLINNTDPRKLNDQFRNELFKILKKHAYGDMFEKDKDGNVIIYPKNREYNKYGTDLIYKRVKLAETVNFKTIIDTMTKIFEDVIKFGEKEK